MARVALDPAYRRISVREFLDMDFCGARAELDDGLIYMLVGSTARQAAIAVNIGVALGARLRGTDHIALGSNFAVRTGEASIRLPHVSVYRRPPRDPANDRKRPLGDPKVVFEVLSPSTASLDQHTKLGEYQALPGLAGIVFVDPETERARIVRRTGPESWTDDWTAPGEDVALPPLDLTLPHAEIFARD